MYDWWEDMSSQFYRAFIHDDRWRLFVEGLGNTLLITFFAIIMGTILGIIFAVVRTSWDRLSPTMSPGPAKLILGFFNLISKVYITVIRGVPIMIQLLIIFFVILTATDQMIVAIIGFGINSGAYVAEIMRSGIQAVDPGQFEAGRSLGFSYIRTMWTVVMPQAFKNILPALCNEHIDLFKTTAIAGHIAVADLTRAAQRVIGVTFQSTFPYLGIALIYLFFVMIFTMLVGKLERRLKNSER
jgi:ABC-type amino acid transport system permease subunit